MTSRGSLQRVRRWRLGRVACAALLTLLCVACGDDPLTGLRKHRDPDMSFVYPENWELTHDTFELDTPDSRVLILRAPGDAVVMLHRFMPPLGWTLGEFANEFSLQRRRGSVRRGPARPKDVRESSISLAPRGRPLEGIRQDFKLEGDGVTSEQTSLFFLIERDQAQIFVSAHAPTQVIDALVIDLRTVLGSLGAGSARSTPRPSAPRPGIDVAGLRRGASTR